MNTPNILTFLNQYKVTKGQPCTHTSMGRPLGSYNIPLEAKEQLHQLIYHTVFQQRQALHLTERPQQYTILKVDLDFKFPLDKHQRQYTMEQIQTIIGYYHQAIKEYLDLSKSPYPEKALHAFVFQREAPYKSRGNFKDGVHIMFPFLICHTDLQHIIRERVLSLASIVIQQIGCKNSVSDVIDKSIISTNGWLMYGCSKPGIKPYLLTHIFDEDFNSLNIKKYDPLTLINILSIRDHPREDAVPLKEEHQQLLKQRRQQSKRVTSTQISSPVDSLSTSIRRSPSRQQRPSETIDLDEIRALTNILSPERADNYTSWMEVGWCLKNIDDSLIDTWLEFSQKSPKFNEHECRQTWCNMEYRSDGFSIGSLHHWAKTDNPEEYQRIKRESLGHLIVKSSSGTTQDVATVVYQLYRYYHKCVSIRSNSWYEFHNHRWYPVDSGNNLWLSLGNEVVNLYLGMASYYTNRAIDADEEQKDHYIETAAALTGITKKLRDVSFKDKVMRELARMFYDAKFVSKLDTNPDLLGFENGVYDLKTGKFRDGCPEDYISLSTGIDYQEFDDDAPEIQQIYRFMSQIFPRETVRDYVLVLLASFLEGRNPNEKFHIWTGIGSNGKSKLLELMEKTIGDYAAKVPVSLLTGKKAGSSAANPELARLKGVRLVSAQEPEQSERFNIGLLKELTGGDRITCRALYKEPIEFRPQFQMIFCCNHLPSLPPDDEGTWRRISLVEFQSRFVSNPDPNNPKEFLRDKSLSEKMNCWREAFAFILLKHYGYYKRHGLNEPIEVQEATQEYRRDNDVFMEFADYCIREKEGSRLKIMETYARFKEWYHEMYGGKPPSQKQMKSSLTKKLGKYSPGGWPNYTLIDPHDSEQEEVLSHEILTLD